jgi:SPP1 family predicted phage head-tail adaptor
MDKCGLNFGQLRHRVELHSPAVTRDAYGQPKETFTKYADAWAKVEPLSMKEQVQNEQVMGERTHRITIRFNEDVDRKDRVVFGSRTFEIVSIVNPDERNRVLELISKEVV